MKLMGFIASDFSSLSPGGIASCADRSSIGLDEESLFKDPGYL
jgi:hypothetical protein